MATITTTAPASPSPERQCPWIDFETAEGRALYRACCDVPRRLVVKANLPQSQARMAAHCLGENAEAVRMGPGEWAVISGSPADRRELRDLFAWICDYRQRTGTWQ